VGEAVLETGNMPGMRREFGMPENREQREVQDPNAWDWEHAERRPGGESKRVFVSVAFSREQFEAVAERAREHGMKTSDFIRSAALSSTSSPASARTPPDSADAASKRRRASSRAISSR